MKRKIALALAAVMAFGSVLTVPFTSVQAVNNVPVRIVRPRQSGTVLSANPNVLNDNTTAGAETRRETNIAAANRRSFTHIGNRQTLGGFGEDSVIQTAVLHIDVNNVLFLAPTVVGERTRSFQIELTGAGWAFMDLDGVGGTAMQFGTVAGNEEDANFDTSTHMAFGPTEVLTVRASQGLGEGHDLLGAFPSAPHAAPEGLFTSLFFPGELIDGGGTALDMSTLFTGPGGRPTETGADFWGNYITGTLVPGSHSMVGDFRYAVNPEPGSPNRPVNLAYVLEVDHRNPRVATVTYYVGEGLPSGGTLVIPVVGYATAANITATVRNFAGQNNVRTPQSNINLVTGVTVTGTTEALNAGVIRDVNANGYVFLDPIMIVETHPGTLAYGASFILEAPEGFEFIATNSVGRPVTAEWNIHSQLPVETANGWEVRNGAAGSPVVATVGLHRFNDAAVVARVGFASHNRGDQDMMNANRNNLTLAGDRWPQVDIRHEGPQVGQRMTDRTRLVVVLNGVETTDLRGGLITVDGLALVLTHSARMNPENYDFTGDLYVSIIGSTRAGNMTGVPGVGTPATTTPHPDSPFADPPGTDAGAYPGTPGTYTWADPDRRGVNSEEVAMARFPGMVGQGLALHRYGGVHTIDAGRSNQRHNNSRFHLYELTQGAWNMNRGFVFDLVGADGELLDGQVKFTSIDVTNARRGGDAFEHLGGTTTLAAMPVFMNDAGNRELAGHARVMQFVNNGATAEFVTGWRTDVDDYHLSQRFDFAVSPHPDFYGPVYVRVSGFSIDGLLVTNTLQLFNVVQRIEVSAESTTIGIGAQTVNVADVVIRDLVNNGVGGNGYQFFVHITEFEEVLTTAAQGIRWNQITPANIVAEGMNVAITLNNATASLGFRVLQRTANQGTVTLQNLQVVITREVTHGVFGVVVNSSQTGSTGHLSSNYSNTDRRGEGLTGVFDSYMTRPYHVREFIVVGTPPDVNVIHATSMRFGITPGNTIVYVNDVATVFYSHGVARPILNVGGTTKVPLRALAMHMGATDADFLFVPSFMGNQVMDTTFVTLGDREVGFFIGTPFFSVDNGAPRAMRNVNGVAVYSIIDSEITYIPFRGFAQAFDIPVYFDGTYAWYNHPAGYAD